MWQILRFLCLCKTLAEVYRHIRSTFVRRRHHLEKPEIVVIHLYAMAILAEVMESSMVGMCTDQTLSQAEGKSELMNYCVGEFPIPCNILILQLISTRFIPWLVLSTSKCCETSEIPCCS
uniref:Uncharacterized protein n=1 Tax=Dromaius novaehollandiae TaxID=8790 RepID=A0A8C4JT47_DRONO